MNRLRALLTRLKGGPPTGPLTTREQTTAAQTTAAELRAETWRRTRIGLPESRRTRAPEAMTTSSRLAS